MIRRALLLKTVILSLMVALAAWSCCETDTTILNIGPGSSTGLFCPDGTTDVATGCGLAPNPVPADHLDIYVDSGNIYTSLDIYRLIIGIPLAPGGAVPTLGSLPAIDQVAVYNPYPTDPSPDIYSANINASNCSHALLTSGENAYTECLGYTPSSTGGNTFANWQSAAQDLGLNPDRFALFYYSLTPVYNTVGHGLYDITLTGNLPVGTMEIAYGCATGYCDRYCYVTPFDNSGQVVPEPSSLVLVGAAGLLLAAARFRRKKA